MVRLAANLSMIFTELPFLDRFAAAAQAGFDAVEFMFPYDHPAEEVAARASEHGLDVVLFNMPPGDWDAGECGIGCHPDRVEESRKGAQLALDYARALKCPRLHLMAGKVGPAGREAGMDTLVDNIRFAADLVAADGIDILLEAINSVDRPGYFYDRSAAVMDVIARVDRPNVKFQYDIYHMQMMEGDLARTIERLLPSIGHIQLADNPGRHEPGTGEINFPWLLDRIDALGYAGSIGCEYAPAAGTLPGLGWAKPYLR